MLPKRTPMKRTLAVALLGLLAGSRAWAQATSAVEQDVIKLEQTVTDAQFKKDRAAIERLLADDYAYNPARRTVGWGRVSSADERRIRTLGTGCGGYQGHPRDLETG